MSNINNLNNPYNAPLKQKNETIHSADLNSFDIRAIKTIKEIISNNNSLSDLKCNITTLEDWGKYLTGINNEKLSENGNIEIVKLLIDIMPNEIASVIHRSGLSSKANTEIAHFLAEKNPEIFLKHIDNFRLENQIVLVEACKLCASTHTDLLMDNLLKFGIKDQKALLEILSIAADYRPDLVIRFIDNVEIEDQIEKDQVIVKCINKASYVVTTSNKIVDFINDHEHLFSASTLASLKKTINARQIPSNTDMQKIFNIFLGYAYRPAEEIIKRQLWQKYAEGENSAEKTQDTLRDPNELQRLASQSHCGYTAAALSASLFGVSKDTKKIVLENDSYRVEELDKVWSLMKENKESFKEKPLSYCIGYTIFSKNKDHVFVIVQHLDSEDNIKYRILQSWVQQYSLFEYITKRNSDLSEDEFDYFTNELNHVLFHEDHTPRKEVFYEHYFMTKAKNQKDTEGKSLEVEWGPSTLDKINENRIQFEEFKVRAVKRLRIQRK